MIASSVMSSDLITLKADASVKDAIALFQEYALHDFPVSDLNGKPVGIVTSRSILHYAVPDYATDDLLAIMRGGPDIESVYVKLAAIADHPIIDVVDRKFPVVKHTMPTSAVAAMLINIKGDSHNVLVVDDDNKLVGIISARDIICRLPE